MITGDLVNNDSYTQTDSALSVWTYPARKTCRTFVIPDGCQDIIVEYREDSGKRYFISELSRTTYSAATARLVEENISR